MIGEDRLVASKARIRGGDGLAITKVIILVNAVDKDHAGFGIIVGGFHDQIPQFAGFGHFIDLALELEGPVGVVLDSFHEVIGDKHREIEHAQTGAVLLGSDEVPDVRVIAPHGAHHGPTAATSRHDRAAHAVPAIHEAQGARGVRSELLDEGTVGTKRADVVSDTTTLLHGEGGFLQHIEDAAQAVRDRTHDVAVEQRDHAASACPCGDTSCGQEAEVFEGFVELFLDHRCEVVAFC